jgi:predicted SAM-dependent methyltransferase
MPDTLAAVDETPPVTRTFNPRFDWQIEVCETFTGLILNVGCNEDPASLQARYGKRVVNCDIEAWDKYMDRPNLVDMVFNCLETPWPFEADGAEVVIFGDILEHFPRDAMVTALTEAHRVAPWVAVTVPEDTRIDPDKQHEIWSEKDYNLHTSVVTCGLIAGVLKECGWEITRFWTAPWGFDDIDGHCVLATRS